MVLRIHSDASYLSVRVARSRSAGCFYLPDPSPASDFNHTDPATDLPPINGSVHILCTILKNVIVSATKTEVGVVFINIQDAVSIRHTLEDSGHLQTSFNSPSRQSMRVWDLKRYSPKRRSKSMYMQFIGWKILCVKHN